MDFTITGVNKIICYTEDFVRGFTECNFFFLLNWVLFFWVWALNRVSVFACLILKKCQGKTQGRKSHLSEISGSIPNPDPGVLAQLYIQRCCLPKRRWKQEKPLNKVVVVGGWFIIWSQPLTFNMHALSFTHSSLLNKASSSFNNIMGIVIGRKCVEVYAVQVINVAYKRLECLFQLPQTLTNLLLIFLTYMLFPWPILRRPIEHLRNQF